MSDAGSVNYALAALDLRVFYNNSSKLVDNYNNDPTATTPEHLRVGAFYGPSGFAYCPFDLNGHELHIAGGVAAYTAPASMGRIGSANGTGKISFATTGGSLAVGPIFIANGATLEVAGPASISGVDTGTSTANGAGFDGTFRFAGNVTGRFVTTGNGGNSAIDLSGNTLTIDSTTGTNYHTLQASAGVSLALTGNLANNASDANSSGRGLIAINNATRIAISGDYASGSRGRLQIGSGASVSVGGDFLPIQWWNGLFNSGLDSSRFWQVDSSATPGVFILNGDGSSTQDVEILSFDYAVSGGTLASVYSGSASRLPFGTFQVGEAGAPASVRLVNLVKNNPSLGQTETMQVARNLAIASGTTLDLNGYQMTVALGTATVNGSITDSYGTGRTSTLLLAENASLAVAGGTVAVDQLTLNSGSNLTLAAGAVLNNAAFSLAGGNTITNLGGSNSIQGAMTLNGNVTLNPQGGTLTLAANIDGPGGLSQNPGAGTIILAGANNTYAGTTQLSSGRLHVTGTLAAGGTVTVDTTGVLSGSGTINRTVIVHDGGAVAPGASPGTLTIADQTWGGGGFYDWQVHDVAGPAGDPSGWDLLDITNALTVTATAGNPFVIRLESLSGVSPDVQGQAQNWDPNSTWSWLIAQAGDGGVLGWDVADGAVSARFAVEVTNFAGLLPKSAFQVSKTGNLIYLNYLLVPEPMSGLLLALGGLLAWRRRR